MGFYQAPQSGWLMDTPQPRYGAIIRHPKHPEALVCVNTFMGSWETGRATGRGAGRAADRSSAVPKPLRSGASNAFGMAWVRRESRSLKKTKCLIY